MKPLLSSLAAMVLLISCTSVTDVATIIAQVQAAAVATCGFLPAAETITAIVTAGDIKATAGLTEGAAIANAICSAETKKSAAPGKVPEVSGTAIRGWFIK